MFPRTITSANSTFSLAVVGLFPTPVTIEGYAADSAFAAESIAVAETHMGVDGKMSAGYIFNPVKMKIQLAADSESVDIFDVWYNTQQSEAEIYWANATVELPGIQKSYVLVNGVMSSHKPFPDAKKTLANVEYEITWESVSQSSI